ncbi:Putative Permease [Clostridium chauvoei JF4335]|nr:Putative Permease [Clostridium chauvoei JF4335]SLK14934.1 Putative Permease [Clostridium chauvoei JF4335]
MSMALIGILIIIIGFALKLNTIAVIISAGIVTGLIADMSFVEILSTLGETFVAKREMCLFLLTLPVIGLCERYGLKQMAIILIEKVKGLSTGKLLSGYLFIRELASTLSVKLGGHPQFVRPLINPMAQGAAIAKYGEIDKKDEDMIKAYAAATDNYGNFFGQNVFMANSGVLLIASTLATLNLPGIGQNVDTLAVAKASIPVAIIAFLLGVIQNIYLDVKLSKKYGIKNNKEGDK